MMPHRHRLGRVLLGVLAAAAAAVMSFNAGLSSAPLGEARLVAFEPLPDYSGETCEWEEATPQPIPYAPAVAGAQLPDAGRRQAVATRKPLTFVQDPYPSFSSIAVDPVRNEVVVTDENRFRIMVYDRTAVTPASAPATEPKRVIGGLNSHTQYASDLYIDQPTGDIYVINNDTVHNTTVYGRAAKGDVVPDREFVVMAGNFGVAVDESRQELYITEQRESAITVWKKSSGMKDTAVRLIQGDQTKMADPHGIAFDPKNRLLFVANYGTSHVVRKLPPDKVRPKILNWPGSAGGFSEIVPGSGKFDRPSITVYSADIDGNMPPVRVIQGPKTRMDHPTGVAFDPDRRELYVADEITETISVFSADAEGDVAPLRVLSGPKTLMKNPSDVFLDFANKEMWVASFGNHLALAYKLGASGDVAPVRIIRGSPMNTPGAMISNPFALTYDTKREQILVTSCVGHPRIAAFARTADKNALPVRSIEGSKTLTNRTMHAIGYDALHDEIVVPSRIGQAILTFRGNADGNEPPIRIIQGPKTGLRQFDKLSVDPVNDEVLVYFGNSVVFFDRTANGDVAPKRILNPRGLRANNAAVDPLHNLLVVSGGNQIWIFDRTAQGTNATPKAVIGGPNTDLRVGQGMALYPPAGKILVAARMGGEDEREEEGTPASPEQLASDKSYIGVWSIHDSGDVPAHWTIMGPQGMLRQTRGLTLDAKNKTVIASDKYLNGVLTYSFPELFESPQPQETARADAR